MTDTMNTLEDFLHGPGMSRPRARATIDLFVDRYDYEPWRHHHNLGNHLGPYIRAILGTVDRLENPRVVLWAVLGHDAIYNPWTPHGVDEQQSAQFTARLIEGLPEEEIAAVVRYINATVDHRWDGVDMDLAYFLDGDMAILGENESTFDAYDENIWREYEPVTSYGNFAFNRHRFLGRVLKQERIFYTDVAYLTFEGQARVNIKRAMEKLSPIVRDEYMRHPELPEFLDESYLPPNLEPGPELDAGNKTWYCMSDQVPPGWPWRHHPDESDSNPPWFQMPLDYSTPVKVQIKRPTFPANISVSIPTRTAALLVQGDPNAGAQVNGLLAGRLKGYREAVAANRGPVD